MKPVSQMTRLEVACYIGAEFKRRNLSVVLSGGSCVSLYSSEKYVSADLDFVNMLFAKRHAIVEAMKALGFSEENRYFKHPESEFLVEFPPGPLGVGEEPVKQIDEVTTPIGSVRLLSPTDCVKDRLTWFYHANDQQCLQQAILVAQHNTVDLDEVKRWSATEGKLAEFNKIRTLLQPHKPVKKTARK
jgi:hypothetical protein